MTTDQGQCLRNISVSGNEPGSSHFLLSSPSITPTPSVLCFRLLINDTTPACGPALVLHSSSPSTITTKCRWSQLLLSDLSDSTLAEVAPISSMNDYASPHFFYLSPLPSMSQVICKAPTTSSIIQLEMNTLPSGIDSPQIDKQPRGWISTLPALRILHLQQWIMWTAACGSIASLHNSFQRLPRAFKIKLKLLSNGAQICLSSFFSPPLLPGLDMLTTRPQRPPNYPMMIVPSFSGALSFLLLWWEHVLPSRTSSDTMIFMKPLISQAGDVRIPGPLAFVNV